MFYLFCIYRCFKGNQFLWSVGKTIFFYPVVFFKIKKLVSSGWLLISCFRLQSCWILTSHFHGYFDFIRPEDYDITVHCYIQDRCFLSWCHWFSPLQTRLYSFYQQKWLISEMYLYRNRLEWRKLVVRSSMVPQRSTRLRDS